MRRLDTPRLLAGARRAVRGLPAEVVKAHHDALRKEAASAYGDEHLGLAALVLQLQADLLDLIAPANTAEVDPLTYYEEHVAPVLARLHGRGLEDEYLDVDLGRDLVCYNLYPPEAANGFPSWRWMGPAPRSGLLIPLGPRMTALEIVVQPSDPAQLGELQLSLSGTPLTELSRSDERNFWRLTVRIPAELLDERMLKSYPYGFLDLEAPTRRLARPADDRLLGIGIGSVKLVGS